VQVVQTDLPGVIVIEPDVHRDERGFFLETYHAQKYEALGITGPFLQDNHSRSIAGTIRGLHIQVLRPQAKLVRAIEGAVYDVAVDVRRGSPHFGRWIGVVLSADNFRQCYIPPGFAHGFAVLSAVAQIEYKCTELYDEACEIGIAWNDPAIGILWPIEQPVMSDRDRQHASLADQTNLLPLYQPTNL
jgi:dTDP-4-dehydrorhamnose 3,5-epimerase